MFKKTMNLHKSIILLRSFSMLCVVAMVLLVVPSPALAAETYKVVDYNDYKANADVDKEEDIVSIQFPSHMLGIDYTIFGPNGKTSGSVVGGGLNVTLYKGYDSYIHYQMPFFADGYLMDFQNIPDGSVFRTSLEFYFYYDSEVRYGTFSGHLLAQIEYYDADFNYVGTDYGQDIFIQDGGMDTHVSYYSTSITVDKPEGAVYGYVSFPCNAWTIEGAYGYYPVSFNFINVTLDMSIDSLYLLWEETGRTNELLEEISGQLDSLPGDIGDEMQDVIDNEKQEAESAGNKFVDQILGELPDPSADVLAALKSLTDATAYTGTDAVLPIPAIVLPGIEGLFPETEVWGGSNLDFGEYLSFLPSSLLTLVQSLFTIAIVLFCVYELKGIISYCLTLRENKGG